MKETRTEEITVDQMIEMIRDYCNLKGDKNYLNEFNEIISNTNNALLIIDTFTNSKIEHNFQFFPSSDGVIQMEGNVIIPYRLFCATKANKSDSNSSSEL